ncbi:MAG: response regulator, partial [Opitutales bacterium]
MVEKILVLDDEENYAELLQGVLEEHYFVTDVAYDPTEALREIEKHGYKLVIADYRMPTMDGAEFLLKTRAVDPDLPVILVSGLMNTPELLKVANLGVTLVFEKPVDVGTFLEAVRRFVTPLSASDFYRFRRGRAGNTGGNAQSAGDGSPAATAAAFPQPLKHVCAISEPTVGFLNSFWHALSEQTHTFVQTPPGSEIELILREAVRWQHREDRPLNFLFAHRPPPQIPDWLTELPGSTTFGHAVGVVGYQLATLEQQEALVDCMRDAPEEVSFVHFLDGNFLELSSNRIHPELLDLIRENLSVFPPLSRRLSDLVGYVQRYLPLLARKEGKPKCQKIAEDAYEMLLCYVRPQNLADRVHLLRTAVQLAEGETLT